MSRALAAPVRSVSRIAAVLQLLAASALVLVVAGDPSTGQIPQECMEPGLSMQADCSAEVSSATAYFGLSPDNSELSTVAISQKQIDAYLANPANKISPKCCESATTFNGKRCNCDNNVLDLVKQYTGGRIDVYDLLAMTVAKYCGFSLQLGATC